MRKLKLLTLLILSVAVLGVSCKKTTDDDNENQAPDNWEIFVYGLTGCGLCEDFENQLDKEKIPYTFYDINTNNEKRAEMMTKLDSAGIPSDSIHWPVVDVMVDSISHMFIQPKLEDIKPLIGR